MMIIVSVDPENPGLADLELRVASSVFPVRGKLTIGELSIELEVEKVQRSIEPAGNTAQVWLTEWLTGQDGGQ